MERGEHPDFLKEVAIEKAKRLIAGFTVSHRRDIASDYYVQVAYPDGLEMPGRLIFTSEGIDGACRRLLELARTQDASPPTPVDEDLRIKLKMLTVMAGGLDTDTDSVAREIANGITSDTSVFYEDAGRDFPRQADEWENELSHQFGLNASIIARRRHRELFSIIDQTFEAAQNFVPPITDNQLGKIALLIAEFSGESNEEIQQRLNGLKAKVDFTEYRKKAYAIRGLIYEPK